MTNATPETRSLPRAPASDPAAVLVVGHGSRVVESNRAFETFVARFAARHPGRIVRHAYVELAEPGVEAALDRLSRRASRLVVAPLFLFAAGHVKNDLPLVLERVRARRGSLDATIASPLGLHDRLVRSITERVVVARGDAAQEKLAVVIVGRGSSDPDANAELAKLGRLLGEHLGTPWVFPAFAGVASPSTTSVLELVARVRPSATIVVPHLLFAGRVLESVRAEVARAMEITPWIRATCLGALDESDALIGAFEARLAEAENGVSPLPCDTCQYRVPIGDVAHRVGGLSALLHSVRHLATHEKAAPHPHKHASIRKHVFVCTNGDCASKGSIATVDAIRHGLREAGLRKVIKVTRTACMGRCGEGPAVVVYPDGVFYRGVTGADARELVAEHLVNDRLVARLVDDILP